MKPFHLQVFLNEVPVERSVFQKDLGLHLDQNLDISKHIKVGLSPSKKKLFASMIALHKCFLFHLKALFVLKIFKILS